MSITTPLHHRRSPIRSFTARLAGHRALRRHDGDPVDRNTSPTDFVLRDYRYVR